MAKNIHIYWIVLIPIILILIPFFSFNASGSISQLWNISTTKKTRGKCNSKLLQLQLQLEKHLLQNRNEQK